MTKPTGEPVMTFASAIISIQDDSQSQNQVGSKNVLEGEVRLLKDSNGLKFVGDGSNDRYDLPSTTVAVISYQTATELVVDFYLAEQAGSLEGTFLFRLTLAEIDKQIQCDLLDLLRTQQISVFDRVLPPSATEKPSGLTEQVASGIDRVSGLLSAGLIKGADAVSSKLHGGAQLVRERSPGCTSPTAVPPTAKKTITSAKWASHGVARASQKILMAADCVANKTGRLARMSVDAVSPGFCTSTMDGAMKVGGAAVGGVDKVLNAVGEAAGNVLTAAVEAGGNVVSHRYGEEAGETFRDGAGTGVDLQAAQRNVVKLNPAHMLGQAARGWFSEETKAKEEQEQKEAETHTHTREGSTDGSLRERNVVPAQVPAQ